VKDSSLRVPPGMDGTVIDVQVFTRDGIEKDKRARQIERIRNQARQEGLRRPVPHPRSAIYDRLRSQLIGKVANGGAGLKKGDTVTASCWPSKKEWFTLRMKDDDAVDAIERAQKQIEAHEKEFEKRFPDKRGKITQGDDLAPGVLKMVKVFLAVKRRIQPGDKMAGRHGNKGVVSTIVPVEDMPYMATADRRHRAEPAGRAVAYEHRPGAGSASGLGRQGPGPEDPAHARVAAEDRRPAQVPRRDLQPRHQGARRARRPEAVQRSRSC
jgi:DNA-directed RNA polymerase subunit beta